MCAFTTMSLVCLSHFVFSKVWRYDSWVCISSPVLEKDCVLKTSWRARRFLTTSACPSVLEELFPHSFPHGGLQWGQHFHEQYAQCSGLWLQREQTGTCLYSPQFLMELTLYTCPNISEASLRHHTNPRMWRNGMGCLCSTQLSNDSGCLKLLRLPEWHHPPEADREGTRTRQKQCNEYHLHSHMVGWGSYITYRRSGCVVSLPVQLEERKQGFWGYGWTFPNSSTTTKSGDQETFWREILQKLLRIFKFSCAIFDLNLLILVHHLHLFLINWKVKHLSFPSLGTRLFCFLTV